MHKIVACRQSLVVRWWNAAHDFSEFLTEETGWPSSVPTYGSSVTLD